MRCNGCGGIVGKDCFNPQECEWISQQQRMDEQTNSDNRIRQLENERQRRILIDDATFLELISGKEVDIDGVKIILEDIGFERMIEMIKEEQRINPT
jgi:hypothetical protein